MLCIEDIKIVEIDRDEVIRNSCELPPMPIIQNDGSAVQIETAKELIKGRKFYNSRGEEVCIGMSEKIQKVLGLPFNHFEKMRQENHDLHNGDINLHNQKMKLNKN